MDLELMPSGNNPKCRPCTSYVLNFNGASRPHRDSSDPGLCILFSVGEWEDGALVLDGPLGLVLDMQPGMVAAYNSAKIVHYNLLLSGKRASCVITKDRSLAKAIRSLPDQIKNLGLHDPQEPSSRKPRKSRRKITGRVTTETNAADVESDSRQVKHVRFE